MTNLPQHRGWVLGMCWRAANAALSLAGVLVLAVAIPPASAQTYTVLYSFTGSPDGGPDGANPAASLIRDAAGNLYGTTRYGGGTNCFYKTGCGTVFKVDPTGKETVVYSFKAGSDGFDPPGGVVRDSVGNLYGTTSFGGNLNFCQRNGCGTVFKIDSNGKETVLHKFARTNGSIPGAGVIRDATGNLYGTTGNGGDLKCIPPVEIPGCGVVFALNKAGHQTMLHSFTGNPDGGVPAASVIRDAAGNLYGTTTGGGPGCPGFFGCGTVFKVDSTGKETVLYSFSGSPDGASPTANLIRDAAGNLYGTTLSGGDLNSNCNFYIVGCGVVFKLDTTGKETVLYRFTEGTDGALPEAGVIRDAAGNLYGTTAIGGDLNCDSPYGCGVVFKLDTTGKETVLHTFTGGAHGATPEAGLVRDIAGNLYGTTFSGGDLKCNCGVVFKLTPH